ncbi:hypothetical protein DL89DRAFT_80731 [Linderina pennispora]|uniref:Uncharacterized protein n=1 Tax=Linderina pennispora TaxID=61395 RepID=A0A1Y1WHE8_9FUNG|nr:uncharacterized protein DL89DRAFT_80731 [Linderina pennispora]ORX72656.1 hypothetical protein DL89DRAFT_80731 [Linderina pennispora]
MTVLVPAMMRLVRSGRRKNYWTMSHVIAKGEAVASNTVFANLTNPSCPFRRPCYASCRAFSYHDSSCRPFPCFLCEVADEMGSSVASSGEFSTESLSRISEAISDLAKNIRGGFSINRDICVFAGTFSLVVGKLTDFLVLSLLAMALVVFLAMLFVALAMLFTALAMFLLRGGRGRSILSLSHREDHH